MALVTTTIASFAGCEVKLRYDDETGVLEEGEVENETGRSVRLVLGSSTRTFAVTLGAGAQAFAIPPGVRNRINMLDDFFLNAGAA